MKASSTLCSGNMQAFFRCTCVSRKVGLDDTRWCPEIPSNPYHPITVCSLCGSIPSILQTQDLLKHVATISLPADERSQLPHRCAMRSRAQNITGYLSNESKDFWFGFVFFWPEINPKPDAKSVVEAGEFAWVEEDTNFPASESRGEKWAQHLKHLEGTAFWENSAVRAKENNFFPSRYRNTNGCHLEQLKSKQTNPPKPKHAS